jgi:glycolate oxidase iron-sulfur subunit
LTSPAFQSIEPLLDSEYDNMLACIRCGLCLTSCPTYVLTLHEAEGPRGRVGMARALAEGQLAVTPDLVQHELNCLVCDACSAVCPAGVHMDPLQVGLRSALGAKRKERERIHVWLLQAVVFGWLFMHLSRMRLFARLLWLYQQSGARWLTRRTGVLRLLGIRELERLLPSMPGEPVVPRDEVYPGAATDPEVRAGKSGGAVEAAFFAGCVMSTALADVDRATIRVLQRAGVTVTNPAAQGCCGALHAHGGDLERAVTLARTNIAAFEGVGGPIVVNSAGCGAMLKDYGHHLRTDAAWAERAAAFSRRVRDLSQVLAERGLPRLAGKERRVVYQDACHLLHAQRVSQQPRELLGQVDGVQLVEIDEAGLCCGSAGIYNVTNPEQSRQLQQRKVERVLAASPDLIVTANPGCLFQLQSGLAVRGSGVRVCHIATVLDEASASVAVPPPRSAPRSARAAQATAASNHRTPVADTRSLIPDP